MSIPPILYTLLKTWEKSREATWRKRWWSNNKYVRHFQNFKTCDLWSIWSKAQNLLDQGDISKCTWLLQPALEIALQYNFYYMDDIPHISFQSGFFFRKFFCEIAGGKRAGKYLLLHMWCLPTCQKSIGIDDMKLNYSEYSNRLCQNIAYFICAKKVVKVQNGFSKRKLFTWCFDEFFGSITKGHYMIVKLKSKHF